MTVKSEELFQQISLGQLSIHMKKNFVSLWKGGETHSDLRIKYDINIVLYKILRK